MDVWRGWTRGREARCRVGSEAWFDKKASQRLKFRYFSFIVFSKTIWDQVLHSIAMMKMNPRSMKRLIWDQVTTGKNVRMDLWLVCVVTKHLTGTSSKNLLWFKSIWKRSRRTILTSQTCLDVSSLHPSSEQWRQRSHSRTITQGTSSRILASWKILQLWRLKLWHSRHTTWESKTYNHFG